MSSNNLQESSLNDIPNISTSTNNDNGDNGMLVSPTTTTARDTDESLPLPLPLPLPLQLPPIHLPSVKYGYRTTRYEWSELKHIILVEQNLDRLCRSIDQQMEYELFKRQVTKTYKSVLDYVLCTKLDVLQCVDAETGLAYAQLQLQLQPLMPNPSTSTSTSSATSLTQPETDTTTSSSSPPPSKTIVVRNDFPYYTAENIHHYVLWKLHGICTDDDIAQAKEDVELELELGGGIVQGGIYNDNDEKKQSVVIDCLHWINPPHLKSLPDIDHVHILCLLQQR